MNRFKIAILGCGNIARAHCAVLSQMSLEAELYAFFDLKSNNADELSAKHKGTYATTDVQKIISDPNVHIVYFCMGHDWTLHYLELFKETGKIVFLEKPLTLKEKDFYKMRYLIQKYKIRVFAGYKTRYNSGMREIKKCITNPQQLFAQVADNPWINHRFGTPEKGTHILCQGVYAADALHFMAGSLPCAVMAMGVSQPGTEIPKSLSAIFNFENGVSGALQINDNGTMPHVSKFYFQASGDGKSAVLANRFTIFKFNEDNRESSYTFTEDGMFNENLHFLGALKRNASFDTGFFEGAIPSIMLFRAIESCKRNKLIKFNLKRLDDNIDGK